MSVQKIRQVRKRLDTVCNRLVLMRAETVVRGEQWMMAREVTFQCAELLWSADRLFEVANVKKSKPEGNPDFKGFVNYVLSAEDKVGYGEWDMHDHDLFLLVAGIEQSGYKLSCSFNQKNDTFSATLMCIDIQSPNTGLILSAFAPDWYNALRILIFKHDVVLEGKWTEVAQVKSDNWG